MSLKECYEAMNGDYEGVIGRLRSEKIVQKFVFKFLDDTSYEALCSNLKEENAEEAFRAAHTIKGVCQNLGFDALFQSSNEMAETLRAGWDPKALELLPQLEKDYKTAVSAIEALKAESEGA